MYSTIACTPNYSKDYEEKKASIDLNASCDGLFKELWPAAKKGDYVARDVLADLVSTRGLTIPGQPADKNWIYIYLTLVVHKDMLEGSRNETKKKIEILGSDLIKQPCGAFVGSCFYTRGSIWGNEAKQGCVDRAMECGLVQPFDEFVQSVDRRLQANEKAICVNRSF